MLAISSATGADGGSLLWHWLAAASFGLALASTVVFNVPINLATGRWDAENPPVAWKETRNKWEFFQGLRSWLLLIGFVLIGVGESLS